MNGPRPLLALVLGLWLACAGGAWAASPFSEWSAVVVAGDWRGSGGGATEAFDNARRDVALALIRVGFEPGNLRQFSTRPDRDKDARPAKADVDGIGSAMVELSRRATSGCLFYLTSHGAPQGAVVDERILRPRVLADMLDRACGPRPTVVVISACFSGVFVAPLARPNRTVLTAARPDRTSFGCGESNKYPFFDECFLHSMSRSGDFAAVGLGVRECVREREAVEKMTPPSEPQLWLGAQLRPILPLYGFP